VEAFKGVIGKSIILNEEKTIQQPAPKKQRPVEEEKVPPQLMTAAQYLDLDVVMSECDSGKSSKKGQMVLTEEEQVRLLLKQSAKDRG